MIIKDFLYGRLNHRAEKAIKQGFLRGRFLYPLWSGKVVSYCRSMIGNLNPTISKFLIELVSRIKAGEVAEQFHVAWADGGGFLIGAKLKSENEPIIVKKHWFEVLTSNSYLASSNMKEFSITASALREVENVIKKQILEYAANRSEENRHIPHLGISTSDDVAKKHELELATVDAEARELIKQDYLKHEAHPANGPVAFSITPSGRKALEQMQVSHFSPTQINQTFNAPVGAVQSGSGNVANVTQNIGANLSEITSLLEALRDNLPDLPEDARESAVDVLDSLQEEVDASEPDEKRINRYVRMLQRLSKGVGALTKWGGNLTTLMMKLEELGIPVEKIPDLFQ